MPRAYLPAGAGCHTPDTPFPRVTPQIRCHDILSVYAILTLDDAPGWRSCTGSGPTQSRR